MMRTLLIARREYAAYARTVGFWLSLLAFPLFAVLGGAVPILIRSSEPVRAVAVVEEGANATGLAAAVRDALGRDADRRAERARQAAEAAAKTTGAPPQATAASGAMASLSRPKLRLVETPADILAAAPGAAQDAAVRRWLTDDTPKDQRLDAVVFLSREGDAPRPGSGPRGPPTTRSRISCATPCVRPIVAPCSRARASTPLWSRRPNGSGPR